MLKQDFENKILLLYPEYSKVYGPYKTNEDRGFIILYNSILQKRRTLSYPKALMEVYLNHRLKNNETVDHIDRDKTNNSICNFQVLDRAHHASVDAFRCIPIYMNCSWCGKEFIVRSSQKGDLVAAGPFCGKRCTGQYGKSVQLDRSHKMIRQKVPPSTYYYIDKSKV